MTEPFDGMWDLAIVKWVFENKDKMDHAAQEGGENGYRCPECGSEEFMVFHRARSDVHTGNDTEFVNMDEETEVTCSGCGHTIGFLEGEGVSKF